MKKLISLLLCLALLLACLPVVAEPATRSFTDSTGRTFELPASIERVAVSGTLAQIVLFALAPDRLVGVASPWDKSAEQYLAPEYYSLPVLGQLYGGKGDMNPEVLLGADPQIVIDVGDTKKDMKEELDALGAQTGIPFVHVAAKVSTLGDAFRMLGELLDMPTEAAVLADYCESVYNRAQDIAGKVDKARLLYITGVEGLNVIAKGAYHGEVIDMLGDNLAVVDTPSSKGTGNEADMEQIMSWNPDVVLFAPDSIYATVGESELWQNVAAIQTGRYYEVPFGPYNWMGFPPASHQLLGMMWMAKLLYPAEADYDLYTEAARFYELFYHCELTREQYDALVAHSIPEQ